MNLNGASRVICRILLSQWITLNLQMHELVNIEIPFFDGFLFLLFLIFFLNFYKKIAFDPLKNGSLFSVILDYSNFL